MKFSSPHNAITCGISQDYILMNTFIIIYNIYENDLPYAFDICTKNYTHCADDTNAIVSPATKNEDLSNSII